MRLILIDTDVLIDVTKNTAQAIKRLTIEAQKAVPTVSSITYKELLVGCRNKGELTKMLQFSARFRVEQITPAIDKTADYLLENYTLSHGLMIPDALIAATALEKNCPLLSKNQKDFRFIKTLNLLPYEVKS